MSIYRVGLDAKVKSTSVTVAVSAKHPLIVLANALDWVALCGIILPDLKKTAKGCWWLGRRLHLRTHLGAFILQSLLKESDRGMEERVRDTPVLQVFMGKGVVPGWHAPDHTKIEEFRSRISPEAAQKLGFLVVTQAKELGFASLEWMDIDSTVQEANISYPSDARLMKKLSEKCHSVIEHLRSKGKDYLPEGLGIDMGAIGKQARGYFFLAKNAAIEQRREVFKSYHRLVKRELRRPIQFLSGLGQKKICRLPWNVRKAIQDIREKGWRYLLDVGYFTRTHKIKPTKILSFHAEEVACIKKGKAGRENEFGRVFQLGRIKGNFLLAFSSAGVKMNDKESLPSILAEYREIFGEDSLQEIGTDKGYYSAKNVRMAKKLSINADGLQRPVTVKDQPTGDHVRRLRDRRAGMEPLIGHAKRFGLGKSKMKSDRATLASGYRSVLGFNLHQLVRHMNGSAANGVQKKA